MPSTSSRATASALGYGFSLLSSLLPAVFSTIPTIRHRRDKMEKDPARQAWTPNEVRKWEEMLGGAVYTLSDIDYMRGSWQLVADPIATLKQIYDALDMGSAVVFTRAIRIGSSGNSRQIL
jgi:hypothetical protein